MADVANTVIFVSILLFLAVVAVPVAFSILIGDDVVSWFPFGPYPRWCPPCLAGDVVNQPWGGQDTAPKVEAQADMVA